MYAEECVGPDQLARGKRGVDAGEVREDADARSWPPGSLAPARERARLKANPAALDPDRLAGKTPLKLIVFYAGAVEKQPLSVPRP